MIRKLMKRTLSVLLVLALVVTTFVIFDPTALFPVAHGITSQDAGSYTFKVTFNISKNGTNEHNSGWGQTTEDTFIVAARTKKNNGRNSATYTYDYWASKGSKTWSGGGKQAYDGGFPDGFYMMGNDNSVVQGVKADITKIEVSGKTVWTGTMHIDSTTNAYYTYVYAAGQGTDGGNDGSYGYTSTSSKDWPMPAPTATYNGSTSVTTNGYTQGTYSIATVKDQYGVNWGFSSVEWSSSHSAATINNNGVATFGDNGGTAYDVTFTPKLKHSSGDKQPAGITVHVTPATYSVSYDGNGKTGGSMSNSSHTMGKAKALTSNAYTRAYTVTYNQNYTGCPANTTDTATYSFSHWSLSSASTFISDPATYSVSNVTQYTTIKQYAIPAPFRKGDTFEVEFDATMSGNSGAFFNVFFYGDSGYRSIASGVLSGGQSGTFTGGDGNVKITTTGSKHYKIVYTLGGDNSDTHSSTTVKKYLLFRVDSTVATSVSVSNVTMKRTAQKFLNSDSVTNLTCTSGGTVSLKANWNSANVTLPSPTRTGYVFGGWYKETGCTTSVGAGGASYTPTANITLYAKWTLGTYSLSVNPDGGSLAASTITYKKGGANKTLPSSASTSTQTDSADYNTTVTVGTPTKTGYKFGGWTGYSVNSTNVFGYMNGKQTNGLGSYTQTVHTEEGGYTNYKWNIATATTSGTWSTISFQTYSVQANETITVSGYFRVNSGSQIGINLYHGDHSNDYQNGSLQNFTYANTNGEWIYFKKSRTFTQAYSTAIVQFCSADGKEKSGLVLDFDLKGLTIT